LRGLRVMFIRHETDGTVVNNLIAPTEDFLLHTSDGDVEEEVLYAPSTPKPDHAAVRSLDRSDSS